MAASVAPVSAAGVLALLDEPDVALQEFALRQLARVIDECWAEATDSVTTIESLSEDPSFPHRELAASIASKCFYHLESYGDAVRLALAAGSAFDLESKSEYAEKIVGECIDEYTSLRVHNAEKPDETKPVDPRLEAVVNRMFDRCIKDGAFTQAVGIALECRRLDVVVHVVERVGAGSPAAEHLLTFLFDTAQHHTTSRRFRREIVETLVHLHRAQPTLHHLAYTRCLEALDDHAKIAQLLVDLLKNGVAADEAAAVLAAGAARATADGAATGGGSASAAAAAAELPVPDNVDELLAYQIAFDLVENDNQKLLASIVADLDTAAAAAADATEAGAGAGAGGGGAAPTVPEVAASASSSSSSSSSSSGTPSTSSVEPLAEKLKRLKTILRGTVSQQLNLHVLSRLNKADPAILKKIKVAQDRFNPITHNATVMAHAFMYCGTTIDDFLRDNLSWLSKATNWAKFTAIAAQGVVHRGNVGEAMTVLQPYLPQIGGGNAAPFTEGGALLALGLINANRGAIADGADVVQYFLNTLDNTRNEVVLHGACLGAGLASMGTGNEAVYGRLREILFQDSAVACEAAGLAMGLTLLGQGTGWASSMTQEAAITELMGHVGTSPHEKTVRGIAMGLSFVVYGQEEASDVLVEQMVRDKDPVVRYGGMYAIGLAFAGTANNGAIRRLLHVAVSDVSDDVRRAAVTALGFVLFQNPDQVPTLVALLAESFNPHVRYGACMATGVACAASGMPEAVALLEPLLEDSVDFVRQGALLALAMVLQQETEVRSPKVKTFRATIDKMIADKHQSSMTKLGAILAAGILDAGGRNACISLRSRAGFTKMSAVVGMAVFLQYWYWFPLFSFLSLSLHPTVLVGLTKDFGIPSDLHVDCRCRPSLFAYPEPIQEAKEEKKERVATVELSTAAKARARAKKRAKDRQATAGTDGTVSATDDTTATPAPAGSAGTSSDAAAAPESPPALATSASLVTATPGPDATASATAPAAAAAEKAKEPSSYVLANPSRVTPAQQRFIAFRTGPRARGERYIPVRKEATFNLGVVMLRDARPGDGSNNVERIRAPKPGEGADGPEPDPPAPFDWVVE